MINGCSTKVLNYPKVGQTVKFVLAENEKLANGHREQAAIVTAVWGPECVNLKVFLDCGETVDRTSVPRAFYNGHSWGFVEI